MQEPNQEDSKEPAKDESVNFDKAEFSNEQAANATSQCAVCQNPLGSSYYKINASISCPQCKEKIETDMNRGTAVGRWFKACLFGIPVAILGALIYFGILALTGYEVGLISILIGWGVGRAVSTGSNYKGGWVYQLLAVLLTYTAICSTYVPTIIEASTSSDYIYTQEELTQYTAEEIEANKEFNESIGNAWNTGTLLQKVVVFLIYLPGALSLPFLMGFQNVIGWIIIGIGLYQAWIMNRKVNMQFEGPFERSI